MRRPPTLLLIAGAALAACGDGGGDGSERSTATSTTESVTITLPVGAGLELELVKEGSYAHGAAHFIRVERPDGSQVFEERLGADRRLNWPLIPGPYRVLSFQRECTKACGPETPETELGAPTDLCGAQFEVQSDKPARAVVKLVAGDGCEISVD